MKRSVLSLFFIYCSTISYSQNVGIGTTHPQEKLDVNGAIKMAGTNNASPVAGTIRWNADKNDFEGYNGKAWVSLTGGKSEWGGLSSYSFETDATTAMLGQNSTQLATGLSVYGDWLVAGAGMENHSNANEAGGFRLFKKENGVWQLKQSVHSPDYTAEMLFGKNVAMNANYIVAGAEGATVNSKVRQGKLYIYSYNSNGANYSTTLTASDGLTSDNFGYSVALYNNFIIAGAPFNTIGLSVDQGSAYVFYFNGNSWQQVANLTAPGGLPHDRLGQSVAIYGNYAVAGAPNATVNNQTNQGKVCLFQYNGSSWSYLTTLTAPVDGPHQYFGSSVSLSGDTLVVGSNENQYSVSGKGKVYVYVRNGNSWNLQTTITAPEGRADDGFGTAVHFNNGFLIVGAPKAWVNGTRQGKSYIYKPASPGWTLQAILTSSHGSMDDRFGNAVYITDSTAFCSAPYADLSVNDNNGRLYFFSRSDQ